MKNLRIRYSLLLPILILLCTSCHDDEQEFIKQFTEVPLPIEFQSKTNTNLFSKALITAESFTEDFDFKIILENGTAFNTTFRASGLIDNEGITNLQIDKKFFKKTGLTTNFLMAHQHKKEGAYKSKLMTKTSCWNQCKKDRSSGFGRAICRTSCVLKEIAKLAKEIAIVIVAIKLL